MRRIFKNEARFNEDGLIIEMSTPMNQILYFGYDSDNRMIHVHNGDSFIGTYNYSESGQLKDYNDTDGVEILYAYDDSDEMIGMVVTSSEGLNRLIMIDEGKLFPIYGQDFDNTSTIRIVDELGYIVDYTTDNSECDKCYKGKRVEKYSFNSVNGDIIEVEFHD